MVLGLRYHFGDKMKTGVEQPVQEAGVVRRKLPASTVQTLPIGLVQASMDSAAQAFPVLAVPASQASTLPQAA